MIEAVFVMVLVALVLGTLVISWAISLSEDGFVSLAFPICVIIWFGIFFYAASEHEKNKIQTTQTTISQQVSQKDESQLLEEKLEKLKANRKIDSLKSEISKLEGGK